MRKRADPAHVATDKVIERLEKQLGKEYAQAQKEVSGKLDDYLKRFKAKDETWRRWVAEGKKTSKEYADWITGQAFTGKRWNDMKDSLAEDYVNVHHIAESTVNGHMAEVYAINHNYATYEIEKGARLRTSYTLYSRESVERMWRENPKLYMKPGSTTLKDISDGKLKRWNRKRIQSVITQGILQGDSIPNFAKRLQSVTGGEHAAAIRNARTMMTGVQNAGRMDAYKRAESMGIETEKTWVSTLDSRTRHEHRQLDGQTVPLDKPFEVDNETIMFPGDPDAEGYLVYNCRCTMVSKIKGHEIDTSDGRLEYTDEFDGMSYDEWKESTREYSKHITSQEETSDSIKDSYIREYRSM